MVGIGGEKKVEQNMRGIFTPLTSLKYGLFWLTKRNTYISTLERIPIISLWAMKINSKMIAFSDNGERGEKIVDVPLAGPIEIEAVFPPRFYSLTRNGWNWEHLNYFSCSFFIFLSSFSSLFISQHKDLNLGALHDFSAVPNSEVWSSGWNLFFLLLLSHCFCSRFSCFIGNAHQPVLHCTIFSI